MKDSGIDTNSPSFNKDRFGCIVGSGIGGVEWFENVRYLVPYIPAFPRITLDLCRIVTTSVPLVEVTIVSAQWIHS
jgi:hypothetical protein